MKIPRRRTYAVIVVMTVTPLFVAGGIVAGGALAAHALPLPFIGQYHNEDRRSNNTVGAQKEKPAWFTGDKAEKTPDTSSQKVVKTERTGDAAPVVTEETNVPVAQPAVASTVSQLPATTPPKTQASATDYTHMASLVASAQSAKAVTPVVYQSARISHETRSMLLDASMYAAGVGLMLYLFSYTRPWSWMYQNLVAVPKSIATQHQ